MSSEAKLTAPMTEGRLTYLDEVWNPGFRVGPHFHIEHAEAFYVLSGQVEWTVNGDTHLLSAGDLVYIPPDTIHATKVVGAENVHILMIAQPGGHEDHLEEEATYTPEQRQQKNVLDLLRSHFDFNPTTMPTGVAVPAPPALPPSGGLGARTVRPAQTAPRPAFHRFVMKGKGETFTPEKEASEVKLTSDDTDGRYSILDEIWQPGMAVPPHYHAAHAEVFYVIDGEAEWTIGGETHVVGAGGLVYIPPNTVHMVKVVGDKDEHSLMLYTPGGYEYYSRRDAQFTPEQRKQPDTQRMLRAEQDSHPVNR